MTKISPKQNKIDFGRRIFLYRVYNMKYSHQKNLVFLSALRCKCSFQSLKKSYLKTEAI